jgi:hypothetical protein
MMKPQLRIALVGGGLALLAIGALFQWVPVMAIGVGAIIFAFADRLW